MPGAFAAAPSADQGTEARAREVSLALLRGMKTGELQLQDPGSSLAAAPACPRSASATLGARFDRILLRIFQQISQIFANLRGLYLGCIEADFCNQILILQHFFRDLQKYHSFAPLQFQ